MGYVNEAGYGALPAHVTVDRHEVVSTRLWKFESRDPRWLLGVAGQVVLGWQIVSVTLSDNRDGLRWCEISWIENSDKATMVTATGLETIQIHPKVSWWNCLKLAWICVFSKRAEKVTKVRWVVRNAQGEVVG